MHWRQRGGGLLSLVNTCGEIGLCTPCTEATPSAEGVASVSGVWRRPPMGWWRASVGGVWAHTPFTEAHTPPTEARRRHPPLTETTSSAEGVASVHGVQRPISRC